MSLNRDSLRWRRMTEWGWMAGNLGSRPGGGTVRSEDCGLRHSPHLLGLQSPPPQNGDGNISPPLPRLLQECTETCATVLSTLKPCTHLLWICSDTGAWCEPAWEGVAGPLRMAQGDRGPGPWAHRPHRNPPSMLRLRGCVRKRQGETISPALNKRLENPQSPQ